MRNLLARIRNGKALWSAYRNVNTLTGDDLANEPMFAQLREFAAAPVEPGPTPVALLMEFNSAQKRAIGRKKFRYGAGALFGTIILFPGLAYAGVLPTPVARVVQQIFDAASVPIQIPSVARESAKTGETATKTNEQPSDADTQMPKAGSTESSNDGKSAENKSSDYSEGSSSSSEPEPSPSPKVPVVGSQNKDSSEDGVNTSSDSSDDLVQGTSGSSSADESD